MNASVIVRWPIRLDQAIHAELTGTLPLDVAALLNQARAEGYAAGRLETLQRIARDAAEADLLGEGWRDRALTASRERRAQLRTADEERALFANRARNIAAGRHPDWTYKGQSAGGSGQVDWDTGYPVETVEAWKRRQAMHIVDGEAS